MSPAIRITGLGKRYRVGSAEQSAQYRTLRDSLSHAAIAAWRRLRARTNGGAEDFWALRDISFDIKPGEVVGIVGRNGAGKSTLLKILSRITKPTTGEIEINGRVGSLLEVGAGFHPELTGRENIYMNGSILGMSRRDIQRRFDEIVEFAEIGKFLDTPVKRYSSGMYVRLAFAVAAHLEPDVLVVDEVLAVGDARFQEKCLARIGQFGTDGRTVLLVSHNMHALSRLARRAALIERGELTCFAPTQEVISRYLGAAADSQHEWQTAEDSHRALQFTSIRFISCDDRTAALTSADSSFDIVIAFTVRTVLDAQISYRLNSNSDGATIFTSALSDRQETTFMRFRPGKYHARCHVPEHLLRPGRYHLFVSANNPNGRQHDLVEQCLSFEVTSIGSLVNLDRRYGYVAPLLDWTLSSAGN